MPTAASETTRDIAKEESNRSVVLEFYDGVFNKHEVEKYSEVIVDQYIQHNPNVPDGKEAFVSFFTQRFKDNPEATSRIVRSATDGDLVFIHVNSKENANDPGVAIVDIFRVDNGKIVEHWDVIQKVPDSASNKNTMF
ncbi:snoaL-like domain protein [Brucella rhizosphaerae]|uniref:SnoaL-like domain protein n=1 Tax=Brucella rhizosphaerae TaxID=571254 RepID=A0A256FUN8_9HYPH|nr:snoaL-like domain protein [Brucella rhizosphaerae]